MCKQLFVKGGDFVRSETVGRLRLPRASSLYTSDSLSPKQIKLSENCTWRGEAVVVGSGTVSFLLYRNPLQAREGIFNPTQPFPPSPLFSKKILGGELSRACRKPRPRSPFCRAAIHISLLASLPRGAFSPQRGRQSTGLDPGSSIPAPRPDPARLTPFLKQAIRGVPKDTNHPHKWGSLSGRTKQKSEKSRKERPPGSLLLRPEDHVGGGGSQTQPPKGRRRN